MTNFFQKRPLMLLMKRARLRLLKNKEEKLFRTRHPKKVISLMARIPEKSVSKDDKVSLGKLEENLKRFIFGKG
ncbi:MAG: hypothetical protein Ct9H90mP22_1600 [Gammaproteobacteria bacterium]|nr:MAG: hypothetical protein Ct9H90mP22_1600 [Gammaproteobacteria bacterium]